MKFTVNTKEIQDVTKKLLKIAPKKSAYAPLKCILLNVTNDKVTVTATDNETTAIVTLKTSFEHEAGSILMSKDTIDIIAKMKTDTVTVTEKEVTAGNRKIRYDGSSPEEYPATPNWNYNETALIMSAARFNNISDIRFACFKGQSRPALTGICFRNKQAISCDSHRLALRDVPEYSLDRDMIIPAESIEHVLRLTEKGYRGEYKVTVCTEHKFIEQAKIEFDNIAMYVRLVDSQYPDVSKIIPQTFKCNVTVNKKELAEELNLMKEVANDKINLVKIQIDNGKIVLSAKSEDNRNALESEIKANVTGKMDTIAFNAELLLDGLKYNSNDVITLNFTDKTTPAMMDNDYLVLPYRVA